MGPRGRRTGFSLIETAIVLVAVGIIFALSSPFQWKAAGQMEGTVTRSHLRNTLTAQLHWLARHQTFTSDRARLLEFDPTLPLGKQGMAGSIYIAISASPSAPSICLFAESEAGEWQTLYYSTATDRTIDLYSPRDCTRRMLDEQLDPPSRRVDGLPPYDASGASSTVRRRD